MPPTCRPRSGGAGLDAVSWILYEKELGHTGYALQYSCVARPSNILLACTAEQRERYLLPAVRGERVDCLAMTEPGAGLGSARHEDHRGTQDGGDFSPQRHQAFHQPRRPSRTS